MLWMIFLALMAIVLVMAAAAARGLEVDRVAGTRFLAAGFFLVLAFVGQGVASIYTPPVDALAQPRLLLGDEDHFSGRALTIMATLSAGVGLFLLMLGAVHLAQSQWRQRLDKFDEPPMSRLDDPDLNDGHDRLDR